MQQCPPLSFSSLYGLLASKAASSAMAMLGRLELVSARAVKMNCSTKRHG